MQEADGATPVAPGVPLAPLPWYPATQCSAWVCLCPAEVTLTRAKNESNEGKSRSRQNGAAQGSCSTSQCQLMLGTGRGSNQGWHRAAPGIPAAAIQLARQSKDWDIGKKGALQEQQSPVPEQKYAPHATFIPIYLPLLHGWMSWVIFPSLVTRHHPRAFCKADAKGPCSGQWGLKKAGRAQRQD